MRTSLKITLLIIAISLPIIALFFYIDSKQEESELKEEEIQTENIVEDLEVQIEVEEPKTEIKTEERVEVKKEKTLEQAGWIPPWDYNNALISLESFESDFHSISPVTFQINNDGTLTQRLDPNLNSLKGKDILLIPTISNFDSNVMKNILENEKNMQRHINSIMEVVDKYEYDGIDLDYESMRRESKEGFLHFVENLSKELNKKNKILSITVLPKWGEGVVYTSLAETRDVQDWEVIGKWSDQVRIMAYDFTHASDPKPGPIAPIDWVEKNLEYAQEKIPKEKTWLGIHLYSYEWVMKDGNKVKTNSYTYNTVKSRILNHDHVEVEYNTEYKEGYAEYSCAENNSCVLYYATPECVKSRKDLAKKHDIAGVTYWRLGGEGELIR